jgi:serine/threonine protein phosphatase PrpC
VRGLLFVDRLEAEVAACGNGAIEICVVCSPSPEHSERNEDAAGVWHFDDGSLVCAVADGMGGTPAGQLAARLAIEHLDASLREVAREPSRRSPILDAFEGANASILDRAPGSGTTLVVAEVVDAAVRVYNVGDSGALLVGQRGRVKLETTHHSPVGYGVAAGLIDSEKALHHEDRHYISNHLGSRDMHIEIGSPQRQSPRDTLLVASDGLFDNVGPARIVELVRRGPLAKCARALADESFEQMGRAVERGAGGKPDDLTIVLARQRSSARRRGAR